MSYILDALKKSEREKTLGQVPTLETVISDGAKKQPTGTPWWVNLLVFLGVLLAILVIMYFAGLINLDSKKELLSSKSSSVQNASLQTETNQPEVVTQTATAAVKQEIEQPAAPVQQENIVEQAPQEVVQPVTIAEPEVQQTVNTTAEIEEIISAEEQQAALQAAEELEILNQLKRSGITENQEISQQTEPEIQQPIQAEPEVPQPVQTEEVATVQQSEDVEHEEALHQNLRSVAVNVVSYSSDARQRFVMLDLTIYKEGDSLQNGAEIIEIQRTGAIVEFQNKRYLLKP